MTTKSFLILILISTLVSCVKNRQKTGIDYRTANGYFVRNDVAEHGFFSEKITDSLRFAELFGMAATMDTRPSNIDFANEFIAAIVLPVTDTTTVIRPDSIIWSGSETEVYYSIETGSKQSYTIRPCLLIIMSRQYDGEFTAIQNSHGRKPDYVMLDITDGKAQSKVNKKSDEQILFAFESNGYKKLSGILSSPDPNANIRFTQIFMPDGTADGPFGQDIEYDLSQSGLYKLSVGENIMAGDPWTGEFTVEISLK